MKVQHLRDVLTILAGGALLLGSGGSAAAQQAKQAGPDPVARSFDELRTRIRPGTTILVTDSAGHEVSGKLGELSDTSLSLLLHGKPRVFAGQDVALVTKRQADSLWNGVLIGVAAGAMPAVYWLFADPNECGGSICMDDLLMGVVPGAAVGLGVDAAIQRKVVVYRRKVVVYRARSDSSTRRPFTIAPTAARRRGVELTISF